MDAKSEAEVWSRVNAAAKTGDVSVRERGPVGPELLEAMTRTQEVCRELRQIQQKTGGETAKALRQMSVNLAAQEKTLKALYYFLTGTPASPVQPKPTQRQERLIETLRRLMQGRELNAGRYQALANRTAGESQRILAELAEEEQKNFYILLKLLKNCV